MKQIIAVLLFACGLATAQVNPPTIWKSSRTAPSGSCPAGTGVETIPGGVLYTCQNGTWTQVSGGGGSSIAPFTTDGTNVTLPSGMLSVGNTVLGPYGVLMPFYLSASGCSASGQLFCLTPHLFSGTYTSGLTLSCTTGQTVILTFSDGATASVACTGSNAIAGGTTLTTVTGGSGLYAAPTTATATVGTATSVSGTPVLATTISVSPIISGFYINGTAALTYKMPSVLVGQQFCMSNGTNITGVIKILAPASTYLNFTGAPGNAAGNYLSPGSAGDTVCPVPIDATHYDLKGVVNSGTNN